MARIKIDRLPEAPDVCGEVVADLFSRLLEENSVDVLYCYALYCLAEQGDIPDTLRLAELFSLHPNAMYRRMKRLRRHALAVMPAHCVYHPQRRRDGSQKER